MHDTHTRMQTHTPRHAPAVAPDASPLDTPGFHPNDHPRLVRAGELFVSGRIGVREYDAVVRAVFEAWQRRRAKRATRET